MFGYILTYVGGIVTGSTLLIIHLRQLESATNRIRKEMSQEVERLRKDNYRLRAEKETFQRNSDCADAYRRGVQRGRTDPMTRAEQFTRNFEDRNVRFVEPIKKAT